MTAIEQSTGVIQNKTGICYSFQRGQCAANPCPAGRDHCCIGCGKANVQCESCRCIGLLSLAERLCENILRSHLLRVHHHLLSIAIHPESVKSGKQPCRALLVAADSCHETDFLEARCNIDDSACVSTSFELVFSLFLIPTTLYFSLNFWTVYGQVFVAVLLTRPATTWSRLRHCGIPGQVDLRTRDCPAGRAGLSPALQKKVYDANRCMDITVWFAN